MGLWHLLMGRRRPAPHPAVLPEPTPEGAGREAPGHPPATAQPLPPLAPDSAPFSGQLSFTVLGHAQPGSAGRSKLQAAIQEFDDRFRDRLIPEASTQFDLNDEMEEPAVWIRITYRVREGEDRMTVGKHFQEICRRHGLL